MAGEKAKKPKNRKAAPERKPQAEQPARPHRKTGAPGAAADRPSHIVGIGASAGGLEAFEQFFSKMPADSGMAFVLVPHLDPTHKSIMAELLRKFTSMEVFQAEDGMGVKPNQVYVIPPDRNMGIVQSTLQLLEPTERRGLRHPIDFFFRSLAQDQGDKAICIVLSGTGTEGALGLKAVKGEGGLVIVQDPSNAKYDGMPQSAIATGLVDYILPADKVPEQLLAYVKQIHKEPVKPEERTPKDSLQKIFMLLRNRTGHDFSLYKLNTISRRIERRMAVHQVDDIANYIRYIQNNPHEIDLLFKELLIRVTNFFRDPGAFTVLKEKVLPQIFKEPFPRQSVRLWVPGCSTGEEAYSLAITVHEYLTAQNLSHNIQIYATDIDNEAIESARAGIYPESISVDVSAERLKRYFSKVDNSFRVSKNIREMVVFAAQNVIKDPPFSKIDLISCRNLLIYLGSELQKKLIPVFHYSLNPGGMLFLGASETIGSFSDLFSVFDSKWKFFKPVALQVHHRDMHFPPVHPVQAGREAPPVALEVPVQQEPSLDEVSRKVLLEMYAPACAIVAEDGAILYFYGRTGKYLEPAQGKANLNIFNMAREGLKAELRNAVHTVALGKEEAFQPGLKVKTNGELQSCNLRVRRLGKQEQFKGLMMVVFEEIQEPRPPGKGEEKPAGRADKARHRVAELEFEVKSVREQLQTTIEELEASNEELQSTNEELQSANEELQSTNEELETSKEELQSVNEELMTVNAESQNKIDQLTRTNDDMNNLLASTDIATVFLDTELRIKRFNSAVRVFKLIASDIGRPISDIAFILKYDNLVEDIRQVLRTLIPQEKQVLDKNGVWYLIRVLPYRTLENVIDGVVLTFVDITEQKRTEKSLAESRDRCRAILEQAREGIVLIDQESGALIDTNPEFQRQAGRKAAELERLKFWDLLPAAAARPARKMFAAMPLKDEQQTRRVELQRPDGTNIEVDMNSRAIAIGGRKYVQGFTREVKA